MGGGVGFVGNEGEVFEGGGWRVGAVGEDEGAGRFEMFEEFENEGVLGVVVGGISEDNIELVDEGGGGGLDDFGLATDAEFGDVLRDGAKGFFVVFEEGGGRSATRERFESDRTRTSKSIEHDGIFEFMLKGIEDGAAFAIAHGVGGSDIGSFDEAATESAGDNAELIHWVFFSASGTSPDSQARVMRRTISGERILRVSRAS